MNSEKLKLIIELAKENPNIDSDKLLQLSGMDTNQEEVKNGSSQEVRGINLSKRWTKADDEDLIVLYNMDLTYAQISKRTGRSINSINSRLYTLRTTRGNLKDKLSTRRRDDSGYPNQGKPYTRFEVDQLESLIREHDFQIDDISIKRIVEIAREFGRSENAIVTQLYVRDKKLQEGNK